MTLIIDAAPLVALADAQDPMQNAVRDVLVAEPGGLIIPAQVTAEVDYLLGRRLGRKARLAFLDDLAVGRFTVECLSQPEYAAVSALDHRYADLELGLAACSVVVLAARFETRRVLTFDHRHFRAVAPLQGGAFELLPER